MKIGILSCYYPPWYGSGISTYNEILARELAAAGHTVHVLTSNKALGSATSQYGETHPYVEQHGRIFVHRFICKDIPSMNLQTLEKITFLTETGAVDLWEAPEARWHSFWAQLSMQGQLKRVPWVVTTHTGAALYDFYNLMNKTDNAYDMPSLFELLSVVMADRVKAPSKLMADWVQDKLHLNEPPTVIPNPADLPPPPPRGVKRDKTILYTGVINYFKGIDIFFDALPMVFKAHPDARVRIIGGPIDKFVKKLLNDFKPRYATGNIQLVPAVPRELLLPEYERAACYVQASRFDSFAYSVLEAISKECPTVISDTVGIGELDTEGILRRFPSGDSHSLAKEIIATLNEFDHPTSRHHGRRLRTLAEKCSPSKIIPSVIDFYEETIRRKAKGEQAIRHAELSSVWDQIRAAFRHNNLKKRDI